MKFLPLGLAVATVGLLSSAGCSAPAAPESAEKAESSTAPEVSGAKSNTDQAVANQEAAPDKPSEANAPADTQKSDEPKTASNAKPDPKYRVVSSSEKFGPNGAVDVIKAQTDAQVPPPPLTFKMAAKPRVVISTSKGAITVELDPKAAPLHAKSFLYLSSIGFFDGTQFHRYVPGFVIQGGDPFTKHPELEQAFGQGGPGYEIPREKNKLTHGKFVLAAARSQNPNSAGSQFYITLDPQPNLDEGDGYTVFGKVVNGKDVVLKLTQGDTLTSAKVQK